jgi:hypothetical protein
VLEVADEQAEMLHIGGITVWVVVLAISISVELWEEMKKHILLDLNPRQQSPSRE